MKMIIEFDDFRDLIKIIHRNLMPDTPIDNSVEKILCEELSLIINLTLNKNFYIEDDDDYFHECEYFYEIAEYFDGFFNKRVFKGLNPRRFASLKVLTSNGLAIVTFLGEKNVKHL